MTETMFKRTEWVTEGEGREYQFNIDEPRVLLKKTEEGWQEVHGDEYRKLDETNKLYRLVDEFEDGYNSLEEINGQWFEVLEKTDFKMIRKVELL